MYVTKFGSHLYGTNTPASDTDYKGIFLPSHVQCFTQTCPKNIGGSTGKNDSRNTKDDIDMSLWSLQYFLQLVSQGETNALDLLYSFTFPEMEVYRDEDSPMNFIFRNHKRLFDIRSCNAYVGYAIGQAKKYGIKGSRLGVLKKVARFVGRIFELGDNINKLSEVIDSILEECYDSSFCFEKEINGYRALVLCGKVHLESISIEEFNTRLQKEYKRYGDRAEQAEKNEGIDWKALSHAVRALTQMKQLIDTGVIRYPLVNAKELTEIKKGNTTFLEVEKRIYDEIEVIDERLKDPNLVVRNKKDNKLIERIILDAYGCF